MDGPVQEEIELVFKEINAASDRSAVILAGAMLDHFLFFRIKMRFKNQDAETTRRLTENAGPLSTSYAKNLIGYALGLYDKTLFNDFEIIRIVRNAFAHSPRMLHFEIQEIKKVCEKFSWHPKKIIEKEIEEKIDGDLSYNRRLFMHNFMRIFSLTAANTIIEYSKIHDGLKEKTEEHKAKLD